jgi:Flp pilus assembly protein TadD
LLETAVFMLLEQLQLLLMLYVRPVRAASRIIDRGRLWFAVCAALVVLFFGRTSSTGETVEMIAVIALAFVPAAILFITVYRSRESFPVTLRKDYLTLLNCVLLCLAAAFLPVAVIGRLIGFGRSGLVVAMALFAASVIYFLVLVGCSVRTLWGTGLGAAIVATLIGFAALVGGLAALRSLGPLMYYLASPFLLYYAYILLGSDVRSLGEGLRARQHLRQQLDISTTNPRDADAQYQLGLIYQQRHQYDEAKVRFARAAEIDSREADPVFQLGRIALEEDRLTDAIELLSRAAALDDKCNSSEVWRDLGVAYFRSDRLEEARAALSKFVERRSYDPEGLYWYGKSLVALGHRYEARQQFEQCKEVVETMPANRRRQLAKWKRLAVAELKSL